MDECSLEVQQKTGRNYSKSLSSHKPRWKYTFWLFKMTFWRIRICLAAYRKMKNIKTSYQLVYKFQKYDFPKDNFFESEQFHLGTPRWEEMRKKHVKPLQQIWRSVQLLLNRNSFKIFNLNLNSNGLTNPGHWVRLLEDFNWELLINYSNN